MNRLLIICLVSFIWCACAPNPNITGTNPVSVTGQDLNSLAAQATQTYIDYKAGNINYPYIVEHGLWAYQMFIKTRDDIKRVVRLYGGSDSFANGLAAIFGASTAPPAAKVAAIAQGVNTAAEKTL